MVIFHSYVKLPEGRSHWYAVGICRQGWKREPMEQRQLEQADNVYTHNPNNNNPNHNPPPPQQAQPQQTPQETSPQTRVVMEFCRLCSTCRPDVLQFSKDDDQHSNLDVTYFRQTPFETMINYTFRYSLHTYIYIYTCLCMYVYIDDCVYIYK